jgi:N-acetylglucosaminyl-diphospho-decaprenol L-rhamnosyltransferase
VSLDLSIVVVSYNGGGLLQRCLESIRASRHSLEVEVIVVDNASSDGSADLARRGFPDATLIACEENLGLGRACNLAFGRARGRYVLLLNQDTALMPGALQTLVEVADAHPEAGAIGPRLEYSDGSFQYSAFRFPDFRQAFFGFFDVVPIDSPINGRYPRDEYERTFAAEHLLGACLLLRREALDRIGGFDPYFFMYFEETDLCVRLQRAGWQNLYAPSARVMHVGAASTSAAPERMSVEFHRGQAYYYRKHRGRGGYTALKAVVWLGTGYRLARSVRAYLRGRIGRELLAERLGGYWKILWF